MEPDTLGDRRLANPWHSEHCSEPVLEDCTDDLLHFLLSANKLADFGDYKRVRGFLLDQGVFSFHERTQDAALMLDHCLLAFLLRLKQSGGCVKT